MGVLARLSSRPEYRRSQQLALACAWHDLERIWLHLRRNLSADELGALDAIVGSIATRLCRGSAGRGVSAGVAINLMRLADQVRTTEARLRTEA